MSVGDREGQVWVEDDRLHVEDSAGVHEGTEVRESGEAYCSVCLGPWSRPTCGTHEVVSRLLESVPPIPPDCPATLEDALFGLAAELLAFATGEEVDVSVFFGAFDDPDSATWGSPVYASPSDPDASSLLDACGDASLPGWAGWLLEQMQDR